MLAKYKYFIKKSTLPAVRFFSFISGLLFCLSLIVQTTAAQSSDNLIELMVSANERYHAGEFSQAIEDYEAITEAGIQNSNVYYNLGNAYFKRGDLGRAILNYRRAHRFDPRDADITANLRLARSQTVDRLEASGVEQFNFGRIVGQWLTLREMAVLLLMFWLLICLCVSLMIATRRYHRVWSLLIAGWTILLVAGLATIGSSFYLEQQFPEAVVIVPEIDVTAGPGTAANFSVNFSLHMGAEVQIIDRRLGWRQIALPGSLNGWVPTDAIESIVAKDG